jgi:glutathione S-transferase
MITIYHIEERRSERVVWLMEELGLPYDLRFKSGDLMGSLMEIQENHPLGYAPTIRDGDVVLVESGAILEYIIHRYGKGRFAIAPESPDYPHYIQWLHLAEGSVAFRLIVEYTILSMPGAATQLPLAARLLGGSRKVLDLAERDLRQRPWFGGQDFTAADIMMHFNVRLALLWNFDLSKHTALLDWYDRVRQRPAYERMVKASLPNGPTTMSMEWATKAEDWR